MRKYNSKTKRTIMIILITFVVFIVIFSLFLKKSMDVAKTAYSVSTGSILYDNEKNKITINGEATIKIKWGGDYYLVYDDKNTNLGKHCVVYDSTNGDIYLYGKYYEVLSNGDVKVRKNQTKVKSSVNSKFYKLADRSYLILDRTIEAVDSSLVTSNYLMVDLDKSGNATLLNDKVSLKTITPTKLRTSSYQFDIPNETLNFGKGDIDLKKVIGSTNMYDADTYNLNADKKNDDDSVNGSGSGNGDGSGSGSGTDSGNATGSNNSGNGDLNNSNGNGGTGNGTNNDGTTAGSSSTYSNNYDSGVSDAAVDEIIKATRNTSVIRVTPGINFISVDYVVYDPNNEYKSVFVEIENSSTGNSNIVYLSKTDTNIVIRDLTPNVYYNLTFKYTYIRNGKTLEYTFDEFGTYTEIPNMTLSVPRISKNKIYYKIAFDNNYTVVSGSLNLLINGQYADSVSILPGNVREISGNDCYFDATSLKIKSGDTITIKLVSLTFNTYTVRPNLSYKFKY